MGFGKKLEEKMAQKGMKQIDLSKAANIPKTTLSSIIKRDNTRVEIDAFLRICEVLNCRPEDFSEEIGSNEKKSFLPLLNEEEEIIKIYRNFNDNGKKKILEYASDLSEIIKYKKGNEIKHAYRVAHTKEGKEPSSGEIIPISDEMLEKLRNAPESDIE